ncbi:MAG: type I 3-dehydroquinate dehydratase [Clostridia bacterium]|nr:type I 3-dehydroquinate dehydratase [Clostridia bacterium]
MATFLNYEKPLLCAMILCNTPKECIEKIKASLADGAEAFGIQLCKLKKEYRTKEILCEIFAACEGLPIYITSYPIDESEGDSDEECARFLLLGLEAGATLCDVTGDIFEHGAPYQLATDPEAVKKQKALIDEIHRRGGEVLMSCHTNQSTTVEENLMIARAQAERGADVLKIVNIASSLEEVPTYIEAIQKILAETDKKLLFLVGKDGRILRYIGPEFGVCMYLCVYEHGPLDADDQPTIKQAKAVRDNIRH